MVFMLFLKEEKGNNLKRNMKLSDYQQLSTINPGHQDLHNSYISMNRLQTLSYISLCQIIYILYSNT